MFMLKFATSAVTANRFNVDHIDQGAIIKFDIVHPVDGSAGFEILVQDSNNDGGRIYPYSIRFVVKHDADGTMSFTPKCNKRLVVELGTICTSEIVYQFKRKLLRRMALHF